MTHAWTLRTLLIAGAVAAQWAADVSAEDKKAAAQKEEERVWAEEEEQIKICCGQQRQSPYDRSLIGTIVISKPELSAEARENISKVDIGIFIVKGQSYILRLDNAGLLDFLLKVGPDKPVNLQGLVRVNSKYFVANNAFAVEIGALTAPPARKKRGGM